MNRMVREALQVSGDFEDAVFIGAVAVSLHTSALRETDDLDFLVDKEIEAVDLVDKGYRVDPNGKKYSPNGYPMDIYWKRDLAGIPLQYIRETAVAFTPSKGTGEVKVASLEVIIVAKHRAGREQDIQDLSQIARTCKNKIKWDVIRSLASSEVEFELIRQKIEDEDLI